MSGTEAAFEQDFEALTGHPPMGWQARLFGLFAEGSIPAALDVPTGLGKTAVMVIWYLARRAGADVPRRLVYVVDRRAVVDQATEVADRIKEKSADGDLRVSTLRGRYADNRQWLADPASPAIIVGTVDMIGSRLLFEGYGVSRNMRPYHAGFLGADTLALLDESHLMPPFERLLDAIAGGADAFGARDAAERSLIPPFRFLPLSATGRQREGEVFRLDAEDEAEEIVSWRLNAEKNLRLVPGGGGKLHEVLAREAWALAQEGAVPSRILVYCNSRDVAEKTKTELEKLAKRAKLPPENFQLFTGARRVKEREDAQAALDHLGFFSGGEPPEKPAFVIATSAGEVGVDLDADHMVMDLAPFERIVQRLGRVNRLGVDREGRRAARVTVIEAEPELPDDLKVRAVRCAALLRHLPGTEEEGFAAGPAALLALRKAHAREAEEATTPEPLYPALTRPLLDAWSMTSLTEHTGRPEVQPWLRGWEKDEKPQTTLVWRTHLPVREDTKGSPVRGWPRNRSEEKEIEEFFAAAPPHESEKLETETFRVVAWLEARAKALPDMQGRRDRDMEDAKNAEDEESRTASVDAPPADEESPAADGGEHRPARPPLNRDSIVAIALTRAREYADCYRLGDFLEDKGERQRSGKDKKAPPDGVTLVLDARIGGLKVGLLVPNEASEPPTADVTNSQSEEWSKAVAFRVRRIEQEQDADAADFILRRDPDGNPVAWLAVTAARKEDARSISKPQTLAAHRECAAGKARAIAAALQLPPEAAEALELAAWVHDEGKRAKRWQRAFKAPRDALSEGLEGPLAKTRGPIDQSLLDHYRHEFGSLAVFDPEHEWHRQLPQGIRDRINALDGDWRDLAQHLVAAHHGGARPVIGAQSCDDELLPEARARNVALRFARLQKRWGPWGLAWWEALLRAADQQASRENEAVAREQRTRAAEGSRPAKAEAEPVK